MACHYLNQDKWTCVMRPDLKRCPYTWWCDWEDRNRIKDKWENCTIAKGFREKNWLRVVEIKNGKLYFPVGTNQTNSIDYDDDDAPVAIRWGDSGIEEKLYEGE